MLARGPARDKKFIDIALGHFSKGGRLPSGPLVFIDDHRPHTFDEIPLIKTRMHEIQFHAKAIGQRHAPSAMQLLKGDGHHERRPFFQTGERLCCPVGEFGS